jgi:hypothetical protein
VGEGVLEVRLGVDFYFKKLGNSSAIISSTVFGGTCEFNLSRMANVSLYSIASGSLENSASSPISFTLFSISSRVTLKNFLR